jgi:hypothetical protein
MSRGKLDGADWEKICQEIPDLSNLRNMVLPLSPDIISINLPPESDISEAPAIFYDVLHALEAAVYALGEVFAHQKWYLKKKEPPNEMAAAFFGRYYADDAVLRLYSAGEQYLDVAIKKMLEINKNQLESRKTEIQKKYKKEGKDPRKITRLEIVGDFLSAQETVYPFTEAITSLTDLKEWKTTVDYRNRWVHEQPPTVAGVRIVYKRGKRWKPLPNGRYALGIGGGDKPEYSVEDLVGFIKPAMFKFTDTLTSVVKFYTELLKDAGKRTVQPLDKGEQ